MTQQDTHSIVTERIRDMLITALGEAGLYLNDDRLTDLLVNPDGAVWIERLGEKMQHTGLALGVDQRERVIRLLAARTGVVCNAESPSLSTILPTGERFQGYLPPVVQAPAFAIRKPAVRVFTLQEYVQDGIMIQGHFDWLVTAIARHENILIAGSTGTGKTTLANAVLQGISVLGERIITIEDTPELQCSAPNHLAKYTKDGVKTMQHCVAEAMRDRPDRIILGEVRGVEAVDLLDAWSTGHPGGLSTVHANSAAGALTRLESLIRRANIPQQVAREMLAGAAPVIVYLERTPGGRRVKELIKVEGVHDGQYVIEVLA